ncbi:MAG: DUF4326 domain-containing protein [Rhodanobacteraceae bacterium]|nr:MAG: DUF4326 domain-containing protein [Rhodanobacteraceae bacterium]
MPHPLVKHWKREGADVYIGRPSAFGNPFKIGRDGDREQVIAKFRAWLHVNPYLMRLARRELAGKTLGCWCAPHACHGDVLAEIANSDAPLPPEPIMVYGSNEAGINGAGAARFASRWCGVENGHAEGISGACYAIPTKDARIRTLPLTAIEGGIARFLAYAAARPGDHFQVTRIGCGLAGYHDDEIMPFFARKTRNVHLPWTWECRLDPARPPRVIVAGSREFDPDRVTSNLAGVFDQFEIDPHGRKAIVVSGGAKGPDTAGEDWAVENRVDMRRYPADWTRYKKAAGPIRNQFMAWSASHLIAYWDGHSPGTKNMIETASNDGLVVEVIS